MNSLILKKQRAAIRAARSTADKRITLCWMDGRVIGRIFQQPQAPEGRPWFWTITAREYPPSIHSRGYSATREQAMRISKRSG